MQKPVLGISKILQILILKCMDPDPNLPIFQAWKEIFFKVPGYAQYWEKLSIRGKNSTGQPKEQIYMYVSVRLQMINLVT